MADTKVVEVVGTEIYDIFVEEVGGIIQSLQELVPTWQQARHDFKLLTDIRRSFHTLKGSGRMVGALALGDFAWAYESMLNQVLSGATDANDDLVALLAYGVKQLANRQGFFLEACSADEEVKADVKRIERFLAGEPLELPNQAPASEPALPTAPSSTPASTQQQTDPALTPTHAPTAIPTITHEPDLIVLDFGTQEFIRSVAANAIDTITNETSDAPAQPEEPEWLKFEQDGLIDFTAVIQESEASPSTSTIGAAKSESVASQAAVSVVPHIAPVLAATQPAQIETQKTKAEILKALPPLVIDRENLVILKLFWEEVPDQLQELDKYFNALQANPADKELRLKLERLLHTIKGGARMAQLSAIGDIAHQAESSLAESTQTVSPQVLQTLQTQIDQINSLAEHYEAQTIAVTEANVQEPNKTSQQVSPPEESSAPQQTLKPNSEQPATHPSSAPQQSKVENELAAVVELVDKPLSPSSSIPTPPVTEKVVAPASEKVAIEYDSVLEQVLAEQTEQLIGLSISQAPLAPLNDNSLKPLEDDPLQSATIQDQVRLPTVFLDRVIEHSSTMNVQQSRTHERIHSLGADVGELGRTVARLRHLLRSLELETEARVHAGIVQQSQRAGFDPLEMDQYSELQRLSRALAESMNDLINIEGDLTDQLRKAEQGLLESIQAGRKIYQDLLSTRLIAINVLMPRLKRVVRQTAQELGKQVDLVIHGDECELDRHLLQRLTAPLEHLLRNALAHGIEMPAEREAKGKAVQGLITLEVVQADAELVIRVIDDGAGLNRAALRQRAIEKGFIKPHEEISDEKLDRLILQPGFTTATTISQISGRGVGMDVVFSEIKSLGGSLHIESVQGLGATFSLRMPFTMASNPVLFVNVQGQTYGLAMGNIQGLIRLSGEEVKRKLNQAHEHLVFDGIKYPLRYLGQALKLRGLRDIQSDTMFPILFTLLNGQARAWVVDAIVGRRDAVMQSLGVLFKNCSLYSAATITPDGQVVLLPDLHELVRAPLPASQPNPITSGIVMKRANDQSRIMVVDDSITVRKVTEKFLVAESFAVETAKDGMEALEKLRDFNPDLLLLDIEMPRMDGFELLRHVRQTPEWKHLPVIMISSRTAEKHREHATALGASDFLGKPYQNQALLDKIRELLEGGTLMKGLTA
ncbi:MAG: response regulator [Thiofilum sp.]|uniref:hybrid sensor histidine kinase/response regulator n=1 Tax=Thiofilum sp. TaxID=2212733 RepID=UPI0025F52FDE|nr:response regulator [Thiofilum sp.]MBK8453073.1 response regulator [Thiofilum sp.]